MRANILLVIASFAIISSRGATASAQDQKPKFTVYTVSLSDLPPSRVWCQVTHKAGVETLVFDPAEGPQGLTKSVLIEYENAQTNLKCTSETPPEGKSEASADKKTNAPWAFQSAVGSSTLAVPAPGAPEATLAYANEKKEQVAAIEIRPVGASDLKSAIGDLKGTSEQRVGVRASSSELSGFVQDTLQLLAEIALDRAKKKGIRFIEKELQSLVCDDLKYDFDGHRFTQGSIRLLPHLCQAIRFIPLLELVESSAKVATALEKDLVELGFQIAGKELQYLAEKEGDPKGRALKAIKNDVLPPLKGALLRYVDAGEFTSKDAEILVIQIARGLSLAGVTSGPKATPLDDILVSFAITAKCQELSGGCKTDQILAMLKTPSVYFGGNLPPIEWPEAASFVARIGEVLSPPHGADPKKNFRSALSLTLDAAVHLSQEGTADLNLERSKQHLLLTEIRSLSLALFDADTRTSVTSGLTILRIALEDPTGGSPAAKLYQAINKITPVVVALTSNAESLKSEEGATDEERKALREARKATLEALIDASTQRAGRGGKSVVSIGANVGFRIGGQFNVPQADGTGTTDQLKPNLSLPMGVAYQLLPGAPNAGSICKALGVHIQASFIDLAQFLNMSEGGNSTGNSTDAATVEWNDFFLLGLQPGISIGDAENQVTVTGDFRYFPGGSQAAQWFIGGAVSYYVPFFDLN